MQNTFTLFLISVFFIMLFQAAVPVKTSGNALDAVLHGVFGQPTALQYRPLQAGTLTGSLDLLTGKSKCPGKSVPPLHVNPLNRGFALPENNRL